ncbi:NACHT domain-containing protein [Streptomyces sp. NPDC020141]|uniref:NACHT domain-containing protein n=1 Tax=Streptomyces sp. NPDC020141 TaxID=3365065 RepID=UPI0037A7764B
MFVGVVTSAASGWCVGGWDGDDRGVTGLGGRRERRVWLLVGVVCALVGAACAGYVGRQLSHGELEASDTASLAAVGLAVVAGLVAVVALRKQSQANTAAFADAALTRGWAATLAGQVEAGEGVVRRQLLGADTRRINLAYRVHSAGLRPARVPGAGRLFSDGPGGPALPDVVSFYRDTRPERLVITGAGGAGKTVLALELLLALVEGRGEADPVPVRVPLSWWDTERQSLPELLETRLVEAYDWPRRMAAGLVRDGMVLPVLDGLDEMDPPGPGGGPDPAAPRATAVVEALNAYQRGREAGPLILTSRTGHYDALPPQAVVVDAARITVEPVGGADAGEYLTGRALDSARWRPLTGHLAADPTGMLAGVLSTPWRLGLTATVYHREGNPAELLALPDADAVDEHLLARYIPATLRTTPNPNGYTPDQVHRWLHHLSLHLDPVDTGGGTGTGGPEGTDLLLHELWPLGGRRRVRATEAVLTTLASLVVLVVALAAELFPMSPVMVLSVLPAAALTVSASRPRRWTNPLRALRTNTRRAAAAVITIGPTAAITIGLIFGITAGIMAVIAIVITIGPTFGVTEEPVTNRGTRAAIRTDALFGLTTGAMAGAAAGAMAGMAFGLAFGLVVGLMVGKASRRYLVFLAWSRRRLPFRLGRFLDWASDTGLMRYSGAAYQYRHRELQHWLRQHPQPPTHP